MTATVPPGWGEQEWIDEVWHRNLDEPFSRARGDLAVHHVLLAHGVVCNDGVPHVGESLSAAELEGAVEGFRWLALDRVADLLLEVVGGAPGADMGERAWARWERRVEARYHAAVRDDAALECRVAQALRRHPDDVAPPAGPPPEFDPDAWAVMREPTLGDRVVGLLRLLRRR